MIDPSTMDPFTTTYRGRNNHGGRQKVFHLDPNCPMLSDKPLKGRLGSTLLTGRRLCSYEAGTDTRFGYDLRPGHNGGRDRPLQTLGVAS